ncbi:acetyl-/propionyl-CoA carboxylase subunit alpha [Streptomyces nojiriensis]|uniref:Acetyl-/propionyl-CoA carboxylase subunit alpha n=1 Tax=Streptomyces nojiriensis TaxID=66374 RepID=A0ABQ3SWS7_9ACTN|nr:biotin carboxylase N-terminal domain-containing protein [Streptomyces nojiriensis]QTI46127.1 Acetyl-/propionyl-coenzyme A carboxylase alpha chain [Streptomyces nojiriensis]GGR87855.1 acetyl-/propionyl-CoA carboxylase subunit alpha [Streptomyces nojiriensis]GHI72603.1 acetyl-/propionyl-CoA carboxylase subunit alpha [Streptomyces nojiriensis]
MTNLTSLLVANRGEIAVRIFRTARALGLATVAVHSDPDADALHVRDADAAVRLPGAAPADTYLRGDLVIKAALAAGADAVHPGYGFLSENADFAREVLAAGLTWIGPPPEAIEAMASKTRAKELMRTAGVPLLDPVDPAAATPADLPLLLKAAAGGGGRGMRVVRDLDQLKEALDAASAEARSAFGDGEVFAEPYVERGRHVEVQILADAHGTVWALGTRDCSLQRRHQKVIEEAPAPGLPHTLRTTLHEAAVAAARAVSYQGAGTVEFLVTADGRPYFLEMNTRLQVEHPVTEAVFGLDLVALQLRVAEGEALPPAPPQPTGHAVEARLYAEDPAQDWRPQTGVLHTLSIPGGIRVDTGFTDGDTVGIHYDPMLAKVVAHAPTRAEAVRALAAALAGARIHGLTTNRELLVRSLRHPEFAAAQLDTGFYDRHLDTLTGGAPDATPAALAAALAEAAPGPDAPLAARLGGWRNVRSQPQTRRYRSAGVEHEVQYHPVNHPGIRVVATTPTLVTLEVEGIRRAFHVKQNSNKTEIYVDSALGAHTFTPVPRFPDPQDRTEPGSLLAPMPGTVVRIAEGLAPGSPVTAGQPLLWLEAMKMEHRILAPASGTLSALHVATGQQVEFGALLAVVQEEPQA